MLAVSRYAWILGDVQSASQYADEARGLIERVRQTTEYPESLNWMHDEIWYPVHHAVMQCLDAMIYLKQGRYQEAIAQVNQAIEYLQQLGDLDHLMTVYSIFGEAYLGLKAFGPARESFTAGLQCAEVLGDNRHHYTHCLGWVALGEGNLSRAMKRCLEALRLAAAVPDWNGVANCLELQAHILSQSRQVLRAATLLGSAASLYQRQHRKSRQSLSLDHLLPGWQAQPKPAAIQRAYQLGLAMSAEEAAAFALG